MKRFFSALIALLLLVTTAAPALAAEDGAPDYALEENWAYFGIGEGKDADLFLICPTVDMKDETNMSLDDEKTRAKFLGALNMERGIYEDSARLFAPYYRQAAMQVYSLAREDWEPYMALAYRDVSDAFAWYLAHENNGRPIILAGFSQGADMCYRLLAEYFGDEALNAQLVAVYAIGWPCTEALVSAYPQIRPAEAADDVGVVVSFDCEAPALAETFITPAGERAYTINPLNWRTDAAPADKSENAGACFTDYSGEIGREEPGLCGCYIDEERGILKVTDIDTADYPALIPGLPEGAYHIYDYQFFFRNLQENVRLRLARYLAASAEAEWLISESAELTEAARAAFDEATGKLLGVHYEPVALLAEQDGVYCILSRKTVVYPGAKPCYALVYVGNGGVQNVWELWIDKHSQPHEPHELTPAA